MKSANQNNNDTEKQIKRELEYTLPPLQIIGNPTLKLLFNVIPLAIVASTTLLTFAGLYTKSGVDVPYLTGGLAIVFSILFARNLFEQFPQILLMLWRRKILCPKQKDDSSGDDFLSQTTYKIFLEFVQAIPKRMNSIVGLICGIIGAIITGWLIWLLDTDLLQDIYFNMTTPFSWYGTLLLVRLTFLITGFVGGIIGWRILVIADTVSKFGRIFDFDLQINHPDGCGGLEPIGDLCLKLAYVISPFPVLLGLWLVFINSFDIRFLRMAPENISSLSFTIVFLTIPTATVCLFMFFLPLGSVHTAMLRAKSRLQIKLDSISQEIHQLSSNLLTKANSLAPQRGTSLEEKIVFLKRVYAQNSQIPTWPYRSTHIWGLISTQIVPALGVISSIIGFIQGFRR
jgi:hypothetical protein